MLSFRNTSPLILRVPLLLACAACGDGGSRPQGNAGNPSWRDAGHDAGSTPDDEGGKNDGGSTGDPKDAGPDASTMIERPASPQGWTERKRFMPPEGAWAYQPRVALAANGVARVVVNGRRLWAVELDTAGNLGEPIKLAEFPNDNTVALAKAADGRLFVGYAGRADDTYNALEAATVVAFDPDTGWSAPEALVPASDREIREMEVMIAADGTAGVAWLESTKTTKDNRIAAALFDGSGWVSHLIDPASFSELTFPSISLDAQDHVLIAWRSYGAGGSGTSGSAARSRYFDGATWGAPVGLFKEPNTQGGFLDLEYAGETGVVVYTEHVKDEGYRLFQREFENDAWSAPVQIDAESEGSVNSVPRLIRSGKDALLGFWAQTDANGALQLWSARYGAGTWSEPEAVSAPGIGESRVEAAANADGSAIMAFSMRTVHSASAAYFSVWTSRYEPGKGWSEPVQHDDGDTRLPRYGVDIGATGDVVLVYERESEVWVSRTVTTP